MLITSPHPFGWKKIDLLIGKFGNKTRSRPLVVVNFMLRDVMQKEVKYARHEHFYVKLDPL